MGGFYPGSFMFSAKAAHQIQAQFVVYFVSPELHVAGIVQ